MEPLRTPVHMQLKGRIATETGVHVQLSSLVAAEKQGTREISEVSFGSYLCHLGQQFVNLDQVAHFCVNFAVVSALSDCIEHFSNFRPFKQGGCVCTSRS
jgi:hypothetical protein